MADHHTLSAVDAGPARKCVLGFAVFVTLLHFSQSAILESVLATGKSIPRIDIPSLGLCFATSQAVVIGVVHRRRRRGTYLHAHCTSSVQLGFAVVTDKWHFSFLVYAIWSCVQVVFSEVFGAVAYGLAGFTRCVRQQQRCLSRRTLRLSSSRLHLLRDDDGVIGCICLRHTHGLAVSDAVWFQLGCHNSAGSLFVLGISGTFNVFAVLSARCICSTGAYWTGQVPYAFSVR